MKLLFSIIFVFCTYIAFSQDDLMDVLNKELPKQTTYATATFKSTRVINGQSIETVAKNHLDFRISHRFGTINSGYKELWGLDQSRIRLGLEYGITDNLMVGVGRSSYQKTYDYFMKWKVVKQSSGARKMPISVAVFFSDATNTMDTSTDLPFYNNLERQSYTTQILIARKFNDRLSLQLSPTIIHNNKTESFLDQNTIYALGAGGRIKLNKRTSFNIEYFYVPTSIMQGKTQLDPLKTNNLSVGFDIETGGHVFQLHVSNSRGMIEKQFITATADSWANGGIYYGFNISRIFSFDKKEKAKKH
ncbi:hypothetical protein EMA8858_00364 [Emticicia aquatica]|uniref:DUF5777 domain-containing protein n=1 Tax=Emticicia aquatica TaxID=1681835 RepID=A0ABM9AKI2_9BACT|nr:DUF5777 family beta-barrel protein [Emticicia aquatica]CAH0994255.1 hypothetical protein EMA8858_00364 [Emticicia aquatica]